MMQRPTPKQASDLGDRIILAPLAINPRLADTAIHQLARDFADGNRKGEADPVNVVILVPSDAAAARWESVADATLHVNDMGPTIDRLIKGEHIGVVVLVNKYDGVDLPGKACRLLIIDGVPSPTDRGADRRREHRRDPRSTGLFLEREQPWVSKSAEATADVTYQTAGAVSPIAIARREAFDKAVAGDPDGAVEVLRRGIDSVTDDLVRGWYLEELASYQHLVDPTASQQTLSAAKRLNPGVLKTFSVPAT